MIIFTQIQYFKGCLQNVQVTFKLCNKLLRGNHDDITVNPYLVNHRAININIANLRAFHHRADKGIYLPTKFVQ